MASGHYVSKATASINSAVDHRCRIHCAHCGGDVHNKGIIADDKAHRICHNCSNNMAACECVNCKKNIYWKRGEKGIKRNCVSHETGRNCKECRQYICGMLVKFNVCKHSLCLKCISYKLYSESNMLKCTCTQEYYIDDIVHYLAGSCEENQIIIDKGYCRICNRFSKERAIQLSCHHTLCISCIGRMEKSEPTSVLPVGRKLTKILFCQGHYCQSWFSIDSVHKIIEEEESRWSLIIEQIFSSSKLKSTNGKGNCDCCMTWKAQAVVQFGCKHTVCRGTLQYMLDSTDKRPVEKNGKIYHLIKCRKKQCEGYECEELLTEWIINHASVIKPTNKEDICDCCRSFKRQAIIELWCHHKLCHSTLTRMLLSSFRWPVNKDGTTVQLKMCEATSECKGFVCEEKLKQWILSEAPTIRSGNREHKCDCCTFCKDEAVIELNCNHRLCNETLQKMLDSPDRITVEYNERTFHLIKCKVKYCDELVCEEKLKEWIVNEGRKRQKQMEEMAMEERKQKKQLEEMVLEERKKQKQLEEIALSPPNFQLTTKDDKCDCCTRIKHHPVTRLVCNHKLCRNTLKSMIDSSNKIPVEKDGQVFHLMKCMVTLCEELVCEEKFKEWIDNEEVTMLGQFVTSPKSSVCYGCQRQDASAIASIPCGHSFCVECFRDMLNRYKSAVLIFTPWKVSTCPYTSCRKPIPILSIENFLAEMERTVNTSGTSGPESTANATVSKSIQSAPTSPSKHGETSDQWDSESRETKGLWNIGLTCYGNCILQVLAQTPNFLEKLADAVTTMVENKDVFNNLCDVLREINECTIDKRVVNYDNTVYLWRDIFSMDTDLELYKQNDSHSFILSLFSLIDTHCSTQEGPISSFEGELLDEFEYSPCKHMDKSVQMFRSLTVPVYATRHTNICTIEECLNNLMRDETFENNLLPCKDCGDNQLTSTTKRLKLNSLPQILLLHIGRATEWSLRGSGTNSLYKSRQFISYTMELPVTVFPTAEEVDQHVKYSLYAVVMHCGSLRSGHYYSVVKNKWSKMWFHCSDSSVRRVAGPPLTSEDAYLLFYEKC